MGPFEGIAKVKSESPVSHVHDIQLNRGSYFITFKQIDASREVEDRAGFDATAVEVDEFGAGGGLQLFEAFGIDFKRHAAFVPAGQAEQ